MLKVVEKCEKRINEARKKKREIETERVRKYGVMINCAGDMSTILNCGKFVENE